MSKALSKVGFMLSLAVCAGGCDEPSMSDASVSIMDLQGVELRSPLEGESVTTEGIVHARQRNGRGFWMQDPEGDGRRETSDGIYVSVGDGVSAPDEGDSVRVTGVVQERTFGRSLSRTEIVAARVERLGSAGERPTATTISRVPDASISEAISFWSSLESMRVRFHDAVVVAPTNRFGEFAALLRAQAVPGSGFDAETSQLFVRPEDSDRVDYNPERVLIDDEVLERQILRPGDRVHDFWGVVDYTFGSYRLQATAMLVDRARPLDPPATTPRVSSAEGGLSVASLNAENLFDTIDDPETDDTSSTPSEEQLEGKLQKLTLAIGDSLRAPEILLLQEVENQSIADTLARSVNRHLDGATSYRARSFPASDGRGIENAVIWDRHRVSLLEAHLLQGEEVEGAFGKGSPSPGREPLVARFRVDGEVLITVNNHFKSKGGDDPLWGSRQPPRRPTERQRIDQARAVRNAVDTWLREDPQALILVAGDFNDFPFPEPGEGPDHPLGLLEASSSEYPLENLIRRLETGFTYIYQGNSQILDHFLVSPALGKRVLGFETLPVNAAYPDSWAAKSGIVYRYSDHDTLLARFHRRSDPRPRPRE